MCIIYNRVLILCEEKSISGYKLSKDIGIQPSIIADLKSGRKKGLSAETASKIAKYFNVSVDYIIGKSDFKGNEVYEPWGYSDAYFNATSEFGEYLKEERERQGRTIKEMSQDLKLKENDIEDLEQGQLPLSYELAEKIAGYLDTSVRQILFDHDKCDETVPEEFQHDVEKWDRLKEAAEEEAKRDSDRVWALKEAERIPSEATPLGTIVYFPVLGRVAAGNGVLAQNEILDYEFTRADKICSGENYFWLKVKGDSMSPKIDDGDLVLVKQQTSVDSGDYAVVLVDGEDGVVKKVCYGADWIELKSVNPYYPVRQFTGPGVQQISVVGRVIEVRRTL